MAYKFQLGSAVLSGSINVASGSIDGSAVSDTLAASIVSEIDNGEIPIAKLAANTISGKSLGNNLDSLSVDDSSIEYSAGSAYNGSAASTIRVKALGVTNAMLAGSIADSKLNQISTANKVALTALDIDGGTALGGASLAQADLFIFDDGAGGTNKKVTFSNLEDSIFGNISSDATVAAGGALTIANDAVDNDKLANIARGSVKVGGSDNAPTDLDAKTSGQILVGDGTDINSVAVSGDIALASNGAVTIQANAVEGAMLNNNTISGQTEMTGDLADTDELLVSDAGTLKRADFSVVRDAVFNDVSGDIAVAAGGAATIQANSVEGSMLNSNVAGTGLSLDGGNLDVAAAQTSITSIINSGLGAIGTAADQEYIDFGTANQIHFVVNDNPVARAVAGTFIVDGNLHVSGTTTTVDSTTINVSSSFTFEGPVDAHETILSVGTPVADTTVQLPEFSSAGTYFMAAFAADPGATGAITATPAELNLVDGGTARGTTEVANGDGFLHNDNGTMRMTNVSSLATLFAGNGLAASDSAIRLDINGLSSAKTTLAQADLIGISDSAASNTAKKVTFSNLEDQIFGNVSGDATIAAGGALTIGAGVIEHGMLAENIITGQTELSLAAIDEADEILVHDADANEVKRYGIDNLRTFINAGSTPTPFGNADATLVVGVNFSNAAPSEDRTLTLPASPVEGQSVRVKANADMAGGAYIIQKAGSQTIDGVTSIKLESPHAAVELVYVGSDLWKVF